MAILQVNFISKSLMRAVPIQVILPVDKIYFEGIKSQENMIGNSGIYILRRLLTGFPLRIRQLD